MPEPLKNLYNEALIENLQNQVHRLYPDFDREAFHRQIFDPQWPKRELKDRMAHIADTLANFLPQKYADALQVIRQAAKHFNGFEYMFFPGFIEKFGIDEFDLSMQALEKVTPFSSAEFAVRPFIIRDQDKALAYLHQWAESDCEHVRRLASEGCRPRLPWAMALPAFKQDPTAILPILEKLKEDNSEYVRRSVANNLNDIAKDNPNVVLETATRWKGQSKHTDWVVKHASRTLLKQGNEQILQLFGYAEPSHIKIKDFTVDKQVALGQSLSFSFSISTDERQLGKLRLEYGVDFMKKNGQLSRKVFKISESDYSAQHKIINKNHSFKPISTRVHYPGAHGLVIIINGKVMTQAQFVLAT